MVIVLKINTITEYCKHGPLSPPNKILLPFHFSCYKPGENFMEKTMVRRIDVPEKKTPTY